MAGVDESNRLRIAIMLTLVGVGLVLIGFALLVHQQQQLQSVRFQVEAPSADARLAHAQRIQKVLVLLLVLVGMFAVASLAFLRWSRRFRSYILHRPAAPTPDGDVWAMHRLPEDDDEPETPEPEEPGPESEPRPPGA